MSREITILVADDDADDRLMIKDAFVASGLPTDVRFVDDGVELIELPKTSEWLRRYRSFTTPGRDLARYQHAQEGRPGSSRRDQGRPFSQVDSRHRADDLEVRATTSCAATTWPPPPTSPSRSPSTN